MARLVRFHGKGPVMVGNPPVAICSCGLSKTFPYCSGAHIHVQDEDEDSIYVYDRSGISRVEVSGLRTKEGDEVDPGEVYSPDE